MMDMLIPGPGIWSRAADAIAGVAAAPALRPMQANHVSYSFALLSFFSPTDSSGGTPALQSLHQREPVETAFITTSI